jgi:FAD/FMN-containing dehydrogenase
LAAAGTHKEEFMTETEAAPASGVLDADALSELQEGFRGEIIRPADPGYDEKRAVFNSMFDRRPAAILRPTGTADVIRAVGLVRTSGAPFAIRGGGHSVAGFSSCEGGIVLDLRSLASVRIDPEKRTARVEAGVDWGTFDREAQQLGLAVTGGRVTTTGVIGFTIGSGSGWLERKLGLACDSVISADVVTADGDLVVATEDENPDLLWGLKGGGGNFGVITSLEFRLHPVEPIVYGGLMAFDPAKGGDVIRTWQDIGDEAPDELGWGAASICGPPAPFVPEQWHGRRMWGVAGMFSGPLDEADRYFAPLRALGPEFDLFQPMPYTALQGLLDAPNPPGRRNYWRAHKANGFDSATIDILLELGETNPSPFSAMILNRVGGAIARVSDDATALGARSAPFEVHFNSMWEGEDGDDTNIAFVRNGSEALSPWLTSGMALNFYTEVGAAEIADSFGARLDRLRDVKRKYDPGNLFRRNQNIAP